LADWVGHSARLLRPLIDAAGTHVMMAERAHADDTAVPVLDPGRGTTKTGRLWCYVRDDRPDTHSGFGFSNVVLQQQRLTLLS
jgi:transposase